MRGITKNYLSMAGHDFKFNAGVNKSIYIIRISEINKYIHTYCGGSEQNVRKCFGPENPR